MDILVIIFLLLVRSGLRWLAVRLVCLSKEAKCLYVKRWAGRMALVSGRELYRVQAAVGWLRKWDERKEKS